MKQETFVGIINALKQQEKRNSDFAEAIHEAFIGANECADFRDSVSYYPPTSMLQDTVLETLAKEFVSDHQTQEQALDLINYWFYELDIVNYQVTEPVDGDLLAGKSVPAYIMVNDEKVPLATPEDLYNELVATQYGAHDIKTTETKPANLQDAISDPTPPEHEGILHKVENVVLKIINDYSVYEIASNEPISNTDMDSLDMVDAMIDMENQFSISFDDTDCASLENCLTPADVAAWLVDHKNLVVPE